MKRQYYTVDSFFKKLQSVVAKNIKRDLLLKQVSFIIVLMFILFSSCQKEYTIEKKDYEYDRKLAFAAPLLNTTFTALDLVEKIQDSTGVEATATIKIDTGVIEKGLLYVEYNEPFNYSWNDIVSMPSFNDTKTINFSTLKSTSANRSFMDTLPLNGKSTQRFDKGEFSEGNFSITLSGVQGDFIVTIENVTKNNNKLVLNVTSNSGAVTADLSGYHVDFVHNADKTESGLVVIVEEDGNIQPGSSQSLTYNVNINSLSPDYLTGYFGKESPMDSTFNMKVAFFKEMDFLEQVKFKGARVFVDYTNYFGVPVQAKVFNTKFINVEDGMSDTLSWDDDEVHVLDNADWNNGNGVIPRIDKLIIGEDNSNLDDLINMYPSEVEFRAVATANPNGEVLGDTNFVTDRNDFISELRLFLPLWLRTEAYVRQDTVDFDIEDMFQFEEDVDEVDPLDLFDFAELTFRFTNAFPFDVTVNVMAENDNKLYIDTLINNKPLFGLSNVDNNGAVDTVNLKSNDFVISFTTSKMREYRDNKVKRIILKETAVTTGDPTKDFVKVHDYNFLRSKVMINIDSRKQ